MTSLQHKPLQAQIGVHNGLFSRKKKSPRQPAVRNLILSDIFLYPTETNMESQHVFSRSKSASTAIDKRNSSVSLPTKYANKQKFPLLLQTQENSSKVSSPKKSNPPLVDLKKCTNSHNESVIQKIQTLLRFRGSNKTEKKNESELSSEEQPHVRIHSFSKPLFNSSVRIARSRSQTRLKSFRGCKPLSTMQLHQMPQCLLPSQKAASVNLTKSISFLTTLSSNVQRTELTSYTIVGKGVTNSSTSYSPPRYIRSVIVPNQTSHMLNCKLNSDLKKCNCKHRSISSTCSHSTVSQITKDRSFFSDLTMANSQSVDFPKHQPMIVNVRKPKYNQISCSTQPVLTGSLNSPVCTRTNLSTNSTVDPSPCIAGLSNVIHKNVYEIKYTKKSGNFKQLKRVSPPIESQSYTNESLNILPKTDLLLEANKKQLHSDGDHKSTCLSTNSNANFAMNKETIVLPPPLRGLPYYPKMNSRDEKSSPSSLSVRSDGLSTFHNLNNHNSLAEHSRKDCEASHLTTRTWWADILPYKPSTIPENLLHRFGQRRSLALYQDDDPSACILPTNHRDVSHNTETMHEKLSRSLMTRSLFEPQLLSGMEGTSIEKNLVNSRSSVFTHHNHLIRKPTTRQRPVSYHDSCRFIPSTDLPSLKHLIPPTKRTSSPERVEQTVNLTPSFVPTFPENASHSPLLSQYSRLMLINNNSTSILQ